MKMLLIVLKDMSEWRLWEYLWRAFILVLIATSIGLVSINFFDFTNPITQTLFSESELNFKTFVGLGIIGMIILCGALAIIVITISLFYATTYLITDFKEDAVKYIENVKQRAKNDGPE